MVHGTIDLMKIDTQGHELRVLQGASRLLSDRIPLIKLEFYPAGMRAIGDQPVELLRLLQAAGYELAWLAPWLGERAAQQAKLVKPRDFEAFARDVEGNRRGGYTDLLARAVGLNDTFT